MPVTRSSLWSDTSSAAPMLEKGCPCDHYSHLSPQRIPQNFRHKWIFKASCTNPETYSSTISVLGLDWVILTFQGVILGSKNFSSIHLFDLYFLAGNCIWKLSHLLCSQSLLAVSKISLIIQTTAHSHEYQKQHLMVLEDFYLHRSWNISGYILIYHLQWGFTTA